MAESQYDLVNKEIFEYNEKSFEQRGGQRREIETIRESVMLYETDGEYYTRTRGDVGSQQDVDGRVGRLYQTESEGNGGGGNQEGKYNTRHFTREIDSGQASQDLEFLEFLSENAKSAEVAEERELANREILANALQSAGVASESLILYLI